MNIDFQQLIRLRQSVRKYTPKKVEEDKLGLCLEAARLAPSASNSQPWSFVVVDDPELLKNVGKASKGPLGTFNNFVTSAPVIIVLVIEKPPVLTELGGRLKKKEYPLIDIGIAADHFCLQAASLGLGTCMLGWFDEAEIKRLLSIPASKTIGLLITLGYSPEGYLLRQKQRKSYEKVVMRNRYTGD